MKKILFWMLAAMMLSGLGNTAMANPFNESFNLEDYTHPTELKLETPAMDPKLDADVIADSYSNHFYNGLTDRSVSPETQRIRLVERPEVKAPKFLDDMTWVGIPVFIAGAIAKSEKGAFRQNYNNKHANTRLVTNFKTSIDDYTQYFGPAMTLGLKLGGVEGRSDWPRMLASAAMSYAGMAIMVNGIKYTASEMRPDGTTRNSWPSGHTATSFVGATILHKEYGLTRSPWYSVAGYGVATATGVMRVLNNRHWVSDVLSGAGIGILCGELGYALSDVFFKGKGLLRNNLTFDPKTADHPSFFSISMGVGLGNNNIDFGLTDYEDDPMYLKFGTSTVVGAEGAYFFNKYVGLGGRLSVKSSPIKGWNNFFDVVQGDAIEYADFVSGLNDKYFPAQTGSSLNPDANLLRNTLGSFELNIESDHMTEFIGSVGLYFNLPLSNRFSLGTKALIGRSVMQDLDINSKASGKRMKLDYDLSFNSAFFDNGGDDYFFIEGQHVDLDGDPIYDGLTPEQARLGNNYVNISNVRKISDEIQDYEWDYLTVSGSSSTSWGTGLSLSYRYKDSFTWRLFCDVDFTKKNYTLSYTPLDHLNYYLPELMEFYSIIGESVDYTVKIKKNMTSWVIGGSFAIYF